MVKRLEHAEVKEPILAVETVDKLTDRQIAEKVREHFPRKRAVKNEYEHPPRVCKPAAGSLYTDYATDWIWKSSIEESEVELHALP